jgi:short-subunit dehydrogenase
MTSDNKAIVITGGASGLGLAIAIEWAKRGAIICIVDRSNEHRDTALESIKSAGGTGHFVLCDVTRDEDVKQLKRYTDENLPPIDVLVNSAGVPTAGTIEAESLSVWQWVLDINLLGTVRVTKAYANSFRKQNNGYIVNVASQAGLTPLPVMGSYNATKAAVIAFSETLKLELAPFNIGVSVLCPAFVKTNLDKSLPKEQESMQDMVTKLVQRGTVTAEQVAIATYKAVNANRFLITTHKEGIAALRLKRWLPNVYYWLMIRRTTPYTIKGYTNEHSKNA